MKRTRQAPPTSSDEGEIISLPSVEGEEAAVSRAERQRGSLPEEPPPLTSLVEEVRSPGTGRAEVDALLAGLSQPLPPEHSPRERADLLLSLIGDEVIATYTGSDGRTVREAAVQALIALGYPYALEVPPEALAASSRKKRGAGLGNLSTRAGLAGFGLVILAALVQAATGVVLGNFFKSTTFSAVALIIGFTSALIPAILALGGESEGSSRHKKVGTAWLKILSALWAVSGLFSLGSGAYAAIAFVMAALFYSGARLMNSRAES